MSREGAFYIVFETEDAARAAVPALKEVLRAPGCEAWRKGFCVLKNTVMTYEEYIAEEEFYLPIDFSVFRGLLGRLCTAAAKAVPDTAFAGKAEFCGDAAPYAQTDSAVYTPADGVLRVRERDPDTYPVCCPHCDAMLEYPVTGDVPAETRRCRVCGRPVQPVHMGQTGETAEYRIK